MPASEDQTAMTLSTHSSASGQLHGPPTCWAEIPALKAMSLCDILLMEEAWRLVRQLGLGVPCLGFAAVSSWGLLQRFIASIVTLPTGPLREGFTATTTAHTHTLHTHTYACRLSRTHNSHTYTVCLQSYWTPQPSQHTVQLLMIHNLPFPSV